MSATGRGAERVENDHYETPIEHARVVFDLLPQLPMLDPCCGRGNIMRAAREHGCKSVQGIEIDPKLAIISRERGFDVTEADALAVEWPDVPLIVMNDPFSLAESFIRKAVEHATARGGIVARLGRLNWIVPGGRSELIEHVGMPDIHTMDRRPSFCMSVKCKSRQTNIETGKTCDWVGTFPVDHPRFKACPSCGSDKISTVTSDATEYAWFVWNTCAGRQTEGRVTRLAVPARKPEIAA